jgi:tRNA A-37 threonylcarbamoyl transferase component Bud32
MQPNEGAESRLANATEEPSLVDDESRVETSDPVDVTTNSGLGKQKALVDPLSDPADNFVGKVLNRRFEITSLIGRGGMSHVYKARDILLNQTFAIKMLRPHLLVDANSVKRLRKEAAASSHLEHINCVGFRYFDTTEEGCPYMVMDYLEGRSIADVLRKEGPLEPKRAVRIMLQVAQALGHAHVKGIVHRDLKANNVLLVNYDGDPDFVKVVDFGIAKMVAADGESATVNLTMTGEIFGSPVTMSPEQCRGDKTDARSDVYSFGCLLYEMLTGKPVFESKVTLELLYKQIHEMPQSFKSANPNVKVPPELEAITFKALQKDPKDRYQSMKELAEDLQALERTTTIGSLGARFGLAVQNVRHNRRSQLTIAGCLVGVLAALLVGKAALSDQKALSTQVVGWQLAMPAPAHQRPEPRAKETAAVVAACEKSINNLESQFDAIRRESDAAKQLQLRSLLASRTPADLRSLAGWSAQMLAAHADAHVTRMGDLAIDLGTMYREQVSPTLDRSAIATAIDGLRRVGDSVYRVALKDCNPATFKTAEMCYSTALGIDERFVGDTEGDAQYFNKMVGDCRFYQAQYSKRADGDYEAASVLFESVMPSVKSDRLHFVSPEFFNYADMQAYDGTSDLDESPLVWDAHAKRAQCNYIRGKYADAARDFEWISRHALSKNPDPAKHCLLLWEAGDSTRMLLDANAQNKVLAEEAVRYYNAGLNQTFAKPPKDLALCHAYVAILADRYKLPSEELPAGVTLKSALDELRTAYGADNPVCLMAEKDYSDSLWSRDWLQALSLAIHSKLAQTFATFFHHK